ITEQTALVRSEVVAPRNELFWEPTTDAGRVVFYMQRIDAVDGVETARMDMGRIDHPFDALLGRTLDVPDGEGSTIPVPTALLMGAIKVAFDQLYNEAFAPKEDGDGV